MFHPEAPHKSNEKSETEKKGENENFENKPSVELTPADKKKIDDARSRSSASSDLNHSANLRNEESNIIITTVNTEAKANKETHDHAINAANKQNEELIKSYSDVNDNLIHLFEVFKKEGIDLEAKIKSNDVNVSNKAKADYLKLINDKNTQIQIWGKTLEAYTHIPNPSAKAIEIAIKASKNLLEAKKLIERKLQSLEPKSPEKNINHDNYSSVKAIETLNINLDRIAKPLENLQKQMEEDKKKEAAGATRAKCVQYVQILGGISIVGGVLGVIVNWLSYSNSSTTTSGTTSSPSEPTPPSKPSDEDLKPFFEQPDSSYWTKFAELVDTKKLSLTDQSTYLNFTIGLENENKNAASSINLTDEESDKITDKLVELYNQADKCLCDLYLEIINIKHQDKPLPRITAAALLQIVIGKILIQNLPLKYKNSAVANTNSTTHSLAISMNYLMAAAPREMAPSVVTTLSTTTPQSMVNAALNIASSLTWASAWFGPYGSAIIGFGQYLLGELWPENPNTQKNDALANLTITLNSLKDDLANLQCEKYSNIITKYTHFLLNIRKRLVDLKLSSSNKDEYEKSNKNILDFLLGNPKIDKTREPGVLDEIVGAFSSNNDSNLKAIICDLESSDDFKYDKTGKKEDIFRYKDLQEYNRAQIKLDLLVSALSLAVQFHIIKIKIESYEVANGIPSNPNNSYKDLNDFKDDHFKNIFDFSHNIASRRANSVVLHTGVLQPPFFFSKETYPVEDFGKETTNRPFPQAGHQLCRFPMKNEENNLLGLSTNDESQKAHCMRIVATQQMIYQHGIHEGNYVKPEVSEYNGARAVLTVTDPVINKITEEDMIISDYDVSGKYDKYRGETAKSLLKTRQDKLFKSVIDGHQQHIDIIKTCQQSINFWNDKQQPDQPKDIDLVKIIWPNTRNTMNDNTWADYQDYEVRYGISHCNLIGGESIISYTKWEPVNKRETPTLENIPTLCSNTVNCIRIYRMFRLNPSSPATENMCVGLLERDKNKKFSTTWQDTMPAIKFEKDLTPAIKLDENAATYVRPVKR